jgi:hypothetical protein
MTEWQDTARRDPDHTSREHIAAHGVGTRYATDGPQQLDLLDAIHRDPTPAATEDAERIRAAILADGKAHGGHISRNRVRAALTNPSGHLDVYHKRVGPAYSALHAEKLIEPSDDPLHIEVNDDHAGGNAGKIARGLRLTDKGWTA